MTGLKFSGVIVPDTDNQAAPETRGANAPIPVAVDQIAGSQGETHAEAEFQALLATYPARSCRSRHLASWCSPEHARS